MTSKAKNTPVNLSTWRYDNWNVGTQEPPAIMNPKTSVHAAIAWCWAEVRLLNELSGGGVEDSALLAILMERLPPIERMLDQLGDRTVHMTETMGRRDD